MGDRSGQDPCYDREADVLYVRRGDSADAVDFDESPEGHHLRFNAAGELVGITFVNAQWLIEQEGELKLSLPPLHVARDDVELALA